MTCEYEDYRQVVDIFGSAPRAFALIKRVTEIDNWGEIRRRRTEDLLVYLALARFRRRPPISRLPRHLQRDIRVAHPVLARSVKLSLRSLQLDIYDYTERSNPPLLHRKDAFVSEDYLHYRKFLRLTQQEERWGLLDNTSTIGTKDGWESLLQAHGIVLRGHRVRRQKPATDSKKQP